MELQPVKLAPRFCTERLFLAGAVTVEREQAMQSLTLSLF